MKGTGHGEKLLIKSAVQQELEQRHGGKDVRLIVTEELDRLRGKPFMVAQAAVALMISGVTLRQWCRDFGIDLADYRNG